MAAPGEVLGGARELDEETGLTATVERRLWTGLHNGRPATYFF
jgi:8-oxo-dGTP pyrophosphatase MutT (NUDIX family)